MIMKQYKSIIVAAAALAVVSCADEKMQAFQTVDPNSEHTAQYAYLNDYADLKSYTNPKASPTFMLGGAMEASDFNKKEQYYALGVANFNEIVAGNDMKMASCVGEKGDMNFTTVTEFVNNATEAGLNVYGHTLAWHAQQPVKWLNSLLKDKELDVDPDKKIETLTSVNSFEDMPDQPFPYYVMGCEPPIVNGAMHFEATGAWSQFFIFPGGNGNTLTEGDYLIRLYMKASNDAGGLLLTIQNGWSNAQTIDINFSAIEGDQVYELQCPGITAAPSANYDVILKPQTANVNLDVKKIEFYKLETPAVEVEQEVNFYTYEDKPDGPFPHYVMGCAPPIVNGALHFVPTGEWSQFFVVPASNNELEEGDYVFYVDMGSDKDVSGVQLTIQNGWSNAQSLTASIPVIAGRHTYALKFPGVTASPSKGYDCILKPQTADAVLDFYSLKVCIVKKLNSIPLTPEEKKDTLTWAMDKWIKGMMEACEGKVKAWDVVNEAISGGDPTKGQIDAEGVYKLQHADEENPDPNSFFWQDYLDDYDYVRTTVKLAREYGPEDIKLFINDYNLESNWDDNGKLKSLIKWIERWESDGVTKIDGIGTQMHISCYADEAVQNSKKNAIVNMLTLMENWCAAGTGRYARISELDMAYVSGFDADGNDITVKTPDMTEEQHHAMADLYQFVIEKYFEIIKPEHQWGICQWCLTDSPANSNWRPGLATGLWSENFYRKHTYAGFANGLAGK